ncbi:MAG: prolyl oligopeptidase family serine peptidase, partial [Verrucomicrobiales bacterium]|nr:prolyl oligopeptidase family serine peptidase [Verrucomicrobiales bacterium]
HGYACLMVDSLQLGEIEATHHGLYRYVLWWWNSRGYTPAGVEAWNAVRSVDYLTSRPEIDPARIGATGRSGGGIGSWWIAALDSRIAAAVPVAGIANLKNHVVDGCVEGHCDCMYPVNTYRWDHVLIAALVAPRPLLVTNSDKDTIFPLDGVIDIYNQTHALYKTLGAGANIGLHITEGPHKDTQPLRIGAANWFHRFLKGGERTDIIPGTAPPVLDLADLRVFDQLPADQRNTTIHDTFVPAAKHTVPTSKEAWEKTRDSLYESLRTRVFAGWPSAPGALATAADGRTLTFNSQSPYRLTVTNSNSIALGENFHPRGTGSTAWTTDRRAHTHIRRRFALLGQTLAGMQVYDTVRATQALGDQKITLRASGDLAAVALYASLFADNIGALHLTDLPPTHQSKSAPDLLNVLRYLDIPQALALAAERTQVHLHRTDPIVADFATKTLSILGTPQNLSIH